MVFLCWPVTVVCWPCDGLVLVGSCVMAGCGLAIDGCCMLAMWLSGDCLYCCGYVICWVLCGSSVSCCVWCDGGVFVCIVVLWRLGAGV